MRRREFTTESILNTVSKGMLMRNDIISFVSKQNFYHNYSKSRTRVKCIQPSARSIIGSMRI